MTGGNSEGWNGNKDSVAQKTAGDDGVGVAAGKASASSTTIVDDARAAAEKCRGVEGDGGELEEGEAGAGEEGLDMADFEELLDHLKTSVYPPGEFVFRLVCSTYAMLCNAMLCYALQCYAMQSDTAGSVFWRDAAF